MPAKDAARAIQRLLRERYTRRELAQQLGIHKLSPLPPLITIRRALKIHRLARRLLSDE